LTQESDAELHRADLAHPDVADREAPGRGERVEPEPGHAIGQAHGAFDVRGAADREREAQALAEAAAGVDIELRAEALAAGVDRERHDRRAPRRARARRAQQELRIVPEAPEPALLGDQLVERLEPHRVDA